MDSSSSSSDSCCNSQLTMPAADAPGSKSNSIANLKCMHQGGAFYQLERAYMWVYNALMRLGQLSEAKVALEASNRQAAGRSTNSGTSSCECIDACTKSLRC